MFACTVPLPPGVNPIAADKYININIIQKWLPCQTKPYIWQMAFHFSLGLNLTFFEFKSNKPDPVGSPVSEYVG